MSLRYQRVFVPPPFDTGWAVWRGREFVGYAVREGRHWLAAEPGGIGRFFVDDAGLPVWMRRRQDATMRLFMAWDGIAP